MSSHARFARDRRSLNSVLTIRNCTRWAAISLVAAMLAGCAADAQNRLVSGADPAEPGSTSRPVGYRSVTAGYVSQRPVNPASWRQQNEQVTPPSQPGR